MVEAGHSFEAICNYTLVQMKVFLAGATTLEKDRLAKMIRAMNLAQHGDADEISRAVDKLTEQ